MRSPSHACFGLGRSGVNMLTNLRFGSLRIYIYLNVSFIFYIPSMILCWMVWWWKQLSCHILLIYTSCMSFSSELHLYDFVFLQFNFVIQDLKYEEKSVKSVQCLNDMVTNALMHVEDCLKYMSNLQDIAIFRFCAIPQVLFSFLYYLFFNCYTSLVIIDTTIIHQ